MARSRPALVRLCELASGQGGDFFALLVEKSRTTTRDGKPFYSCRFRDAQRCAVAVIWSDSGWFETCERDWQEGQFYKIRGGFVDVRKMERVLYKKELGGISAAHLAADGRTLLTVGPTNHYHFWDIKPLVDEGSPDPPAPPTRK